jgi:hypothetical protein
LIVTLAGVTDCAGEPAAIEKSMIAERDWYVFGTVIAVSLNDL